MLVFGGSSRTHTLRIHQRDALQLLEEQHAALTKQLAALEKEIADPAAPHARSGRRARRQASQPRAAPGGYALAQGVESSGPGRRSALAARVPNGAGAAATRQCSPRRR